MAEDARYAIQRRHVITLGTGRFRDSSAEPLSGVARDLDAIAKVFAGFGYRQALRGLGEYESADHIRQRLRLWCRDEGIADDDLLVVYFAGHGVVDDRHYLACWDTDAEDPAGTALPTEDLVRVLINGGARHLLLIIDTCYGGAGAAEAAQVALRRLANAWSGDLCGDLWFLASARARDVAYDDEAFAAALPAALRAVTLRSGQRQRFLDLHDLVEEVTTMFGERGRGQRAELVLARSVGVPRFLPNDRFRAELPPEGTDLESQHRAADRELTEHFGPRARGVDFESEAGTYFSGRTEALTQLVAWLDTHGDGKGRVVTGRPGCGKSAVVSRIVALSRPEYRATLNLVDVDPRTLVAEGVVDAAVHARHKRLEDLVTRIAEDLNIEADGAGSLLRQVSLRARAGQKTVIVVDALDEAGSGTASDSGGRGEPRRIARELLRPLAEIRGVHLLVGSRREVVPYLGAVTVLDLDRDDMLGTTDIHRYVTRMLTAAEEPEVPTPYRDRPDLAGVVAEAVARRAAGVFLVARMTARSLRDAAEPVDTTRPGWADRLPSRIGEAFDAYLERFGDHETRVRRLLVPVAFAEGQGLPDNLWPLLAGAIADIPCSRADVEWVVGVAKPYLAEVREPGQDRSVFRLYHQTLAEHLRDTGDPPAEVVQRRIVAALTATVPGGDTGVGHWFGIHPYIRANLATHAAAGGRVDDLVSDPGFLLMADQSALLSALHAVVSRRARRVRAAYEQVAHRLTSGDPADRAAYLQLSARRCDAPELAEAIDRLGLRVPWRTRWADWSATGAHRRLLGHAGLVSAVAFYELDGRPVAVSGGGDGEVRTWDLITSRLIGEPVRAGEDAVNAVAVAEVDDFALLLLGCGDGLVRVHDLSTGRPLRQPLVGHTNAVLAVAAGVHNGRPVAVTGGADGIRVWDLATGTAIGNPVTGGHTTVRAVAVGRVDGRTVAVAGGVDGRVRTVDLADGSAVGEPLAGHTEAVTTMALGTLDGRPLLVTGSEDQTIQVWDLAARRPAGEPIPAHQLGVCSVALGVLDGRSVVVSGGQDGCVRVWDARTRQPVGQTLVGHTGAVGAVAAGTVSNRPVAVTGGYDRTVRVWNLTADAPRGGHARPVGVLAFDSFGGEPYLVTGSSDGSARCWDLTRRAEAGRPMVGHAGAVSALVARGGAAGRLVVTGDAHGTVRIWDPEQGVVRAQLDGHTNAVTALCHSRIGDRDVVVSGSDDGTVRLWDLAAGASTGPPLIGHHDGVGWLTTGEADGRPVVAAASSTGRVSVWWLDTHQPLRLRLGGRSRSNLMALACHGGRIVALHAERGNTVLAWDVLAESALSAPLVGHRTYVLAAAVADVDGVPVALTVDMDGEMRFWDLRAGVQRGAPMRGHPAVVQAVALGALGGRPVAATSDDLTVRLWDLDRCEQLGAPVIGYDPAVTSLAVTSDRGSSMLASTGDECSIVLRDLGGEPVVTARMAGSRGWAELVRAVGDGALLGLGAGGTARVWDVATRSETGRFVHESGSGWYQPHALAVTDHDGRAIAVAGTQSGVVRLWDVASRTLLGELTGHTAQIWSIAVTGPGDEPGDGPGLLATGSSDSTVRLWDLTGRLVTAEPLTGHEGDVNAVAFARWRGGLVVVSGDDEGVVRCWSTRTGLPVEVPFTKHPMYVTDLLACRLADLDLLCVASADGTVRIWNLGTGTLVAELNLETSVQEMVLAPGGLLCLGTQSGLVAVTLEVER